MRSPALKSTACSGRPAPREGVFLIGFDFAGPGTASPAAAPELPSASRFFCHSDSVSTGIALSLFLLQSGVNAWQVPSASASGSRR